MIVENTIQIAALVALAAYMAWRYARTTLDPDLSMFYFEAFGVGVYGRDYADCKTPAIHAWYWGLAKLAGRVVERVKFAHHHVACAGPPSEKDRCEPYRACADHQRACAQQLAREADGMGADSKRLCQCRSIESDVPGHAQQLAGFDLNELGVTARYIDSEANDPVARTEDAEAISAPPDSSPTVCQCLYSDP